MSEIECVYGNFVGWDFGVGGKKIGGKWGGRITKQYQSPCCVRSTGGTQAGRDQGPMVDDCLPKGRGKSILNIRVTFGHHSSLTPTNRGETVTRFIYIFSGLIKIILKKPPEGLWSYVRNGLAHKYTRQLPSSMLKAGPSGIILLWHNLFADVGSGTDWFFSKRVAKKPRVF